MQCVPKTIYPKLSRSKSEKLVRGLLLKKPKRRLLSKLTIQIRKIVMSKTKN